MAGIIYQDTVAKARVYSIQPAYCAHCHLTRPRGLVWQYGYDDGRDPQYVGYQCRNCGHVQGLTRATILRRIREDR